MFLISPRNTPAAVIDMLRQTGCRHLLASRDTPVQSLVQAVSEDFVDLTSHRMPSFKDFELDGGLPVVEPDQPDGLPGQHDMDGIAMILHSSGLFIFAK